MDRTACVDVPAFALQLLLRRRSAWRTRPVAVVAEDRPQAFVLCVNTAARAGGVAPGMRHGAALALSPSLCAGVVPDDEIAAAVTELTARLLAFTPGVEPVKGEPGAFFLDASGLTRLHGSLHAWAGAVVHGLAGVGLRSRAAVGFTRFGVYAAAKTTRGVVVFDDADAETRAAQRVPLERLGAAAPLTGALAKLGVRTAGDFLRLPEEGLLRRFGDDALRLRRFADAAREVPLVRAAPPEPLEETDAWEHPVTDTTRLLFTTKRLLDRLVARVAERDAAVAGITLVFTLDLHPPETESLRPAAPTLSLPQILDLVHLRLAPRQFPSGVLALAVTADTVAATAEQLRLFAERPRRDPAAALRAFARLRAEYGDDAVVTARLADGHLPEARFAWDRLERVPQARPRIAEEPPLVRRILARPLALPPRAAREPDGWFVRGPEDGPVERVSEPCVVAGGWWRGAETRREYVFAEAARGRLFWTFFDARRRSWFLQGFVE